MPIERYTNKAFFKHWSVEMAYALGFFAADGSMIVGKRGNHYIELQSTDRNIMYAIRKALKSDLKMGIHTPKRSNHSTRYRLQVGSHEMYNDLVKLGFQPSKSKRMRIPNIPKIFIPDFIRGYFDGDGNIWIGIHNKHRAKPVNVMQAAFTSCSLGFLRDLRQILHDQGLGNGSLTDLSGAYRLQYGVHDSILLYHVMYDNLDSNLFLNRKKKRFETFIERMRP